MNNVESLKFLDADEAPCLVKQYGRPVFIYDLPTIKKNYDYFSQTPNPYGLTVRYSVKANPTRAVLAYSNQHSAAFGVSSVWEPPLRQQGQPVAGNTEGYPEAAEVCRVTKNNYQVIRESQMLDQMTQNERDLPLA